MLSLVGGDVGWGLVMLLEKIGYDFRRSLCMGMAAKGEPYWIKPEMKATGFALSQACSRGDLPFIFGGGFTRLDEGHKGRTFRRIL